MSVLARFAERTPRGLNWGHARCYLPIAAEQVPLFLQELSARTGRVLPVPRSVRRASLSERAEGKRPRGFGWVAPTLRALASAARPRRLSEEWRWLRTMLRDLYYDRRFLLEENRYYRTEASLCEVATTLALAATLGFPPLPQYGLFSARDWCGWLRRPFVWFFEGVPYPTGLPFAYPERVLWVKRELLGQLASGCLALAQDACFVQSPLRGSLLYTVYRLGDLFGTPLAGLYFHLRAWYEAPVYCDETVLHQQHVQFRLLGRVFLQWERYDWAHACFARAEETAARDPRSRLF